MPGKRLNSLTGPPILSIRQAAWQWVLLISSLLQEACIYADAVIARIKKLAAYVTKMKIQLRWLKEERGRGQMSTTLQG